MEYDVIGDVHGQAGKLVALLLRLGYRVKDGAWRHPQGRIAAFVGDLIDRGPAQVEVVRIVRRMVDARSALVVMGNHEYNAIGFATPCVTGYLRPHSAKNQRQHGEFLRQVGLGSPLHEELVGWFKTLPVALDLGGIRVCHAWWDDARIAVAERSGGANGRLPEDFLLDSFDKTSPAYDVLEGVAKGLEVRLPEGAAFTDHGGALRHHVRVRWWDETAATYRDAAIVPEDQRAGVPDLPLAPGLLPGNPSRVPVFVGHYWWSGEPAPQNANTAVLDYGAGLDGPLVAYRWEGETTLVEQNFVSVG